MIRYIDCEPRELNAWFAVFHDCGVDVVSVCPEAMGLARKVIIGWNGAENIYGEQPSEVVIWRIFYKYGSSTFIMHLDIWTAGGKKPEECISIDEFLKNRFAIEMNKDIY